MTKRKEATLKKLTKAGNVYTEMLDDIMTGIKDGVLSAGSRLPSEKELRDRYEISVNSVRRGIDVLIEKGIVERRHGSGMYICESETPFSSVTDNTVTNSDTIAVMFDTTILGYHPFFSEVRKAIYEKLTKKGWQIWEPKVELTSTTTAVSIFSEKEIDQRVELFRKHGKFAGAILASGHISRLYNELNNNIPFVVPSLHKDIPFVAYNWRDEAFQAIRSLYCRGAKNILVLGTSHPPETVTTMLQVLENSKQPVTIINHEVKGTTSCTKTTYSAYESTLTMLRKNPEIDGIVAGSDYIAQGVFDALTEMNIDVPKQLKLAALINKNSPVSSAFPYTAVVSDGYFQGTQIAELIHEKIIDPQCRRNHVWLRGYVEDY